MQQEPPKKYTAYHLHPRVGTTGLQTAARVHEEMGRDKWEQKEVGCEGCYPDGADSTCAGLFSFFPSRLRTASHQPIAVFLETVLVSGRSTQLHRSGVSQQLEMR